MSGEKNTPTGDPATPQCQFFVQRKKRLCRMTVKPGRRYCGEHEPQPAVEAGQTDKRIPCPNDPKHTCYASKLLKHLAICNARRTEQPPYIVHNINVPEEAEPCPRRPLSSVPKEELASVIDKINYLYAKHVEGQIAEEPTPAIHRAVAAEFGEPGRTESSLRHLRQVSALLALAERAGLARPGTCYVELGAGKGQLSYYACHAWCGGGRGRVLAVDRAPLRHKRDNKLRSAPPGPAPPAGDFTPGHGGICRESVEGDEMDATDGDDHSLGYPADSDDIRTKFSNDNVTDDPTSSEDSDRRRHENADQNRVDIPNGATGVDSSIRIDKIPNTESELFDGDVDINLSSKGTEPKERTPVDDADAVAVRLRADLAHLALARVPCVARAAAVVALAKHLCGAATDLALRCVAAPAGGLVLAPCCHHRVEPAVYVGATHLQELGVSAEELNIILGVVSWATCGDGRPRRAPAHAHAHAHGRERDQREDVGRKAKALVDWGRVLWLRARGLRARLVQYVAARVSPENRAIVAVRA